MAPRAASLSRRPPAGVMIWQKSHALHRQRPQLFVGLLMHPESERSDSNVVLLQRGERQVSLLRE